MVYAQPLGFSDLDCNVELGRFGFVEDGLWRAVMRAATTQDGLLAGLKGAQLGKWLLFSRF